MGGIFDGVGGFGRNLDLPKFPKLDIYASFDGVGKVGEYIRHGFNFNKFDQNIQKDYR